MTTQHPTRTHYLNALVRTTPRPEKIATHTQTERYLHARDEGVKALSSKNPATVAAAILRLREFV
jgi:hypothetical protein